MLLANNKLVSYIDTRDEALSLVSKHFKPSKKTVYTIQSLDGDIEELNDYVSGLKKTSFKKKAIKVKPRKEKTTDRIDNNYSNWLSKQGCLITGKKAKRGTFVDNMHCHHIHGRKFSTDDYMQVPLYGKVHNDYHSISAKKFIDRYNIPGIEKSTDTSDIKANRHNIIKWFEYHASCYLNKYNKINKKSTN